MAHSTPQLSRVAGRRLKPTTPLDLGWPWKRENYAGNLYYRGATATVMDAAENHLLYYFCSNRDKSRNTALAVMRGIIHQWIDLHPHLAQYIKKSFEGTETTKCTVSSFATLWGVFLTLLRRQSGHSQVVCVLDGLDECEKESLSQLLDAVGNYLSNDSPEKIKATTKTHPPLATPAGCFGEQTRPISAD